MKERASEDKDVASGVLIEREKKDMVIVSTSSANTSTASTGDKGNSVQLCSDLS